MLDIDLHDMFRKSVSSFALPFIYRLTIDVWISSCFVDYVSESKFQGRLREGPYVYHIPGGCFF